jgi:hypothetical protein
MADTPTVPIEAVAPVAPVASVAPQTAPVINNTPYADTMTPAQAQSIVAGAGIDPNAVLSAGNVNATINNPAPAPDDLLGIRSEIYNNEGVNTAQTALTAAQAAAATALNNMNARITGLGGRTVSMSKITGSQAQERLVSQGEIDALNSDVANKLTDYQLKKGNADDMFGIRSGEVKEKQALMTKYAGAGIKVSDSFEQASAKIEKYADEQKKEIQKDALKDMALSLGLSTSGSRADLRRRISKANKTALDKADKLADLKIEAMKADIENTRSQIADRNNGGAGGNGDNQIVEDDMGNSWNIQTDKNGKIIGKEQIFPSAPEAPKEDIGWGGTWNQPSTWFNSWGSGN